MTCFLSACSYGNYGQNCSRKCNVTCTGCNKVNGLCDSGCYPGWKGDYCLTRKRLQRYLPNKVLNDKMFDHRRDNLHVKVSDLHKKGQLKAVKQSKTN